jgi:hypothetical protein
MFSPLLNILTQYGGPILAGVLIGFVCKVYFAARVHSKMRDYQGEILKSHAKILELEALTDQLEKKIKGKDVTMSKEFMMN